MSRRVHLEAIGGISGDMFAAACLDAGVLQLDEVRALAAALELPFEIEVERCERSTISGLRFLARGPGAADLPPPSHRHDDGSADHDHKPEHTHHHHHAFEIYDRIGKAALAEGVRRRALAIFDRVARAEAKIHGLPADQVVFHEVGAWDSLLDVVIAAAALERLSPAEISCSPLPLGSGEIVFSHGRMPAPGPAVLELLRGVPVLPGFALGEQTTPTGAAIARHAATRFGDRPAMVIDAIGYGHGSRDFGAAGYPNSLRLLIGAAPAQEIGARFDRDEVVELVWYQDDAAPTEVAELMRQLEGMGALDCVVRPALGKKGRPGHEVSVLCPPDQAERIAAEILRRGPTIGLRLERRRRLKLYRDSATLVIDGVPVRIKRVFDRDHSIERWSPEEDDVIALARARGLTPNQARGRILAHLNPPSGKSPPIPSPSL